MSTIAFAFVAGVLSTSYAVAGLFFLSFWRRTQDGLFLVFGFAFWLMALNQALPLFIGVPREELSWVYLLRLAAFILIIIAILRKNLSGRA